MVEANITTYIGQCNDAEHYYCRINDKAIEKEIPNLHSNVSACGNNELFKTLKTERDILALKNKGCYYKIGDTTNRFNSIDEIHKELILQYPNETIITYLEDSIYKEMLYIKNGVNLGYKRFGNVFISLPRSCYKDLIDFDNLIIKCHHCDKTYNIEDITSEFSSFDYDEKVRQLLKFLKYRDIDDTCECIDLVWNQIL